MTAVLDPTVQRRRLRVELKKAREAAHLAQAEVARAMDWSHSKLIRIERGDVSVSINDVRALLNHYGVENREQVDRLIELARSAYRRGSAYDQYAVLLKPGLKDYLAYEATAAMVRQYEHAVIPELLQTEDYGREILRTAGWVPDEVDQLLTVLQNRQDALRRENSAGLRFILDEAALARIVGRHQVMRHQLERLRDLSAESHISIQIIPFAYGAYPSMAESFVMLDFADPNLDDMVFLETTDQKTMLDNDDSIARYRGRFTLLTQISLTPIDSASFLERQISAVS